MNCYFERYQFAEENKGKNNGKKPMEKMKFIMKPKIKIESKELQLLFTNPKHQYKLPKEINK